MNEELYEFQYLVKKTIKDGDYTKLKEICNSDLDADRRAILKKYVHKELKKNNNATRVMLGFIEIYDGNFDAAENIFNRILNDSSYYLKNNGSLNNKFYIDFSNVKLAEIEYYRGNYDNAKNLVKKALNSNDYSVKNSVYYLLGRINYIEKNYDCAFEYFKKMYEINPNRFIVIKNMAYVKFAALEYEEAFSLFMKYYDVTNGNVDENTLNTIIFISKKLNIFIKNIDYSKVINMYGFNQIIDYSKDRMLKHVKKHFDKIEGKDNFREDLDINNLIEEIKDKITVDNLYPNFCVGNSYSIYYPNIGENGSNYLRVVTLPETKQILTIFPIKYAYDDEENKSCMDMDDSKNLLKR